MKKSLLILLAVVGLSLWATAPKAQAYVSFSFGGGGYPYCGPYVGAYSPYYGYNPGYYGGYYPGYVSYGYYGRPRYYRGYYRGGRRAVYRDGYYRRGNGRRVSYYRHR